MTGSEHGSHIEANSRSPITTAGPTERRYDYDDTPNITCPPAVTCDECHAEITGTVRIVRTHAYFMGESAGGTDRTYCDRCWLRRGGAFMARHPDLLIICVCDRCGRVFTIHGYYAKPRRYCTRHCRARARSHRHRPAHRPVKCAVCREWFKPQRRDAAYCSDACRQRAYRQRTARPAATKPEGD